LQLIGDKPASVEMGIVPDCSAVIRLTVSDLSLALQGAMALRQLRDSGRIECDGTHSLVDALFRAIRIPALTGSHSHDAPMEANALPRV
jgi:hypothetical protein